MDNDQTAMDLPPVPFAVFSIAKLHTYIPLTLYPRYSSETPTLYQNLAMRNIAYVTGGKPIAILLQFVSGVSAINPLVAFYDIHGGAAFFETF
jgi:hypothetical protein